MGRWGGKATTEMSKFDLIFTFGLFAAIWHLRDTPVTPDPLRLRRGWGGGFELAFASAPHHHCTRARGRSRRFLTRRGAALAGYAAGEGEPVLGDDNSPPGPGRKEQ